MKSDTIQENFIKMKKLQKYLVSMENYPKHYKTQGLLIPYLMLYGLMILKKKHLKKLQRKQKPGLEIQKDTTFQMILLRQKMKHLQRVKMARGTSLAILINDLRAEVGHSLLPSLGKATRDVLINQIQRVQRRFCLLYTSPSPRD